MPGSPEITRRLELADKICVATVVAIYAATLFYLLATALFGDGSLALFARTTLVPAVGFVVLSVIRKAINSPRPYDLGEEPLMTPSKSGESMPSRHASSGAIIATTLLTVSIPAALVCYACTVGLSVVRVKGGLHFKKDVIVGILCGIAIGGIAVIIPV